MNDTNSFGSLTTSILVVMPAMTGPGVNRTFSSACCGCSNNTISDITRGGSEDKTYLTHTKSSHLDANIGEAYREAVGASFFYHPEVKKSWLDQHLRW